MNQDNGQESQEKGEKVETIDGYRIKEPLKSQIAEYLNTRPYGEVEDILEKMFEKLNPETGYLTWESILILTDYLKTCPRKDVKPYLVELTGGMLERYSIPAAAAKKST